MRQEKWKCCRWIYWQQLANVCFARKTLDKEYLLSEVLSGPFLPLKSNQLSSSWSPISFSLMEMHLGREGGLWERIAPGWDFFRSQLEVGRRVRSQLELWLFLSIILLVLQFCIFARYRQRVSEWHKYTGFCMASGQCKDTKHPKTRWFRNTRCWNTFLGFVKLSQHSLLLSFPGQLWSSNALHCTGSKNLMDPTQS